MRAAVALSLTAILLATPALAQETERYRLERTEDGFVRMDKQTGRMSICKERSGELVCRASSDGHAADQERIEELEARVAALERLAAGSASGERALPSPEEFERSLGYMRRFFQNFFDIVREWEQDGPREPGAMPDRT